MSPIWLKIVIYMSLFVFGIDLLGWSKCKIGTDCQKSNVCSANGNKLLSILNLLCNATQNTSIQSRDACYGCFFRAGSLPAGPALLQSLGQCATIYLNNTTYIKCAPSLTAGYQPNQVSSTSQCYTGYCDFVRCVRRINANRLIDTCLSANLLNRNFTDRLSRIAFYVNTTSCVLAMARCNAYNPITGEYQLGGGQSRPYNSLQISRNGDLRIVSFPATVNVADYFCSKKVTLEQSGDPMTVC